MNVVRTSGGFLLALAGAPRPAGACSPPPCAPGYLTPGDNATVPANLPAVYWRPGYSTDPGAHPDPTMVVLSAASDPQTALAVTATALSNGDYLLMPDAPLVSGTDYTVVDHTPCTYSASGGAHVTFHVVDAAPLPTSLGTLAIVGHQEETFQVATISGACSADVVADQARLELTLSADALAWKDALHYQTFVDGQQWYASTSLGNGYSPGSSWVGRAVDRLYHVCSSVDTEVERGLPAGTHQATMTATLPGSTVSLDAAAGPVDLECSGSGSGSGSGSNGPPAGDHVDDGCNTGSGSAVPLALLTLLAIRRRARVRA